MRVACFVRVCVVSFLHVFVACFVHVYTFAKEASGPLRGLEAYMYFEKSTKQEAYFEKDS